jgi:hypothetical protein
MSEGLFTFGTLETVEIPSAGPGAANDAVAKAPLGVLTRYKGNLYRYVKFDDGVGNIAAAVGAVVYWKALDPTNSLLPVFTVTTDISDAIGSGVNLVAGVLGAVVTDQYYTWIQISGVVTALTAASTAAGDGVTYGTDSTFGRMASGSYINQGFGTALTARNTTAGTNSVLLQNLDW